MLGISHKYMNKYCLFLINNVKYNCIRSHYVIHVGHESIKTECDIIDDSGVILACHLYCLNSHKYIIDYCHF